MQVYRYSLPAIVLHWAQAILILWLLWLGWNMVDLPKGAERSAAYGLHKSLGLVVILLTVLRLGWRLYRKPPPAFPQPALFQWLAALVHVGLYAFLILAPLAGFISSSSTQYAMKFFGMELPRLLSEDKARNELFKAMHFYLVYGGAALIALHIGGAIHHRLRGEPILQRMLPGRGR